MARCCCDTRTRSLQSGEDCLRGPELRLNRLGGTRSFGVDIAGCCIRMNNHPRGRGQRHW